MKSSAQLFLLSLFILRAAELAADEITLESAPPVVVKTIPESGANDVDPTLTEIKVTFSKPMLDKSWSSTTISKESFPEVTGQPKYLDDHCTFVLPVKLVAGKTYAVLLNSERFKNFKDADGHSAMPYLLIFKTKGDPPAANNSSAMKSAWTEEFASQAFDRLWEEMDRNYSYFALKPKVDWISLKEKYRPLVAKSKNSQEFAAAVKPMLAALRDIHVWIETPSGRIQPFGSGYAYNGNHAAVREMLENSTRCGEFAVVAKTMPDGYGYFLMTNQSAASDDNVQQAIAAIQKLHEAPGFVVDLRQANGGDELLARQIAQLFCEHDTVYAKSKYRSGASHIEFTDAFPRSLAGVKEPYTKPVVCLIGPGAVSSGEAFAQMMKCLPQVTTVGLPTRGASGNPRPYEIPGADVTVWFSRWVDLMPDGESFEGQGIEPEVKVDKPAADYGSRDPTLDQGLAILRQKTASLRDAKQ